MIMRTRLTEIISTIDYYNRVQAESLNTDIQTNVSSPPLNFTVNENEERLLKGLLLNETTEIQDKVSSPLDRPDSNVLSLIRFIEEGRLSMTNVSSYFGCLDDDEEEE